MIPANRISGKIDRCCNPFNLKHHLKKNGLRHPSPAMIKKIPSLHSDYLICVSCGKKIRSLNDSSMSSDKMTLNSDTIVPMSSFSTGFLNRKDSELSILMQLSVINQELELIGNSLIPKKRCGNNVGLSSWMAIKIQQVSQSLKQVFGIKFSEPEIAIHDLTLMIAQIKEAFHASGASYERKIELMSLLPKTWNISHMAQTIGSTYHIAKVAKNLATQGKVLSMKIKRKGSLSAELMQKVINFYHDDDISFLQSGKKVRFLSCHNNKGVQTQKRLLLGNLRELYRRFKEIHPDVSIGFSSFAELRPDYCILAESGGTHTVCICSSHQNFKLMMTGCKLQVLSHQKSVQFETYEDVLQLLVCRDFNPLCHFNRCAQCPGDADLKRIITEIFSENNVESITYKSWIITRRCTLITKTCSADEFVEVFCNQARSLLQHSFIAKQQSSYQRFIKDNLANDECMAICDFAENYAFIIQDVAPGFHWNNNQATVYSVVLYYKLNGILNHKGLIIISDCLHHDAITVWAFSRFVNEFAKSLVPNVSKIIYFSDGAPQFKNFKNFSNIYHHEIDFGVRAEWHFFATAHGKGPCDGIGGTLKRLAARASLQRPIDQQILNPMDLFNWANEPGTMPSITIKYWDKIYYEMATEFIRHRYVQMKRIPPTEHVHCVIPSKNFKVIVKDYSFSDNYTEYKIIELKNDLF